MSTLNLGILAHVDAGKTTLTERLLFAAGVTDTLGSVDDGTTQTDSLELERRRGITIRAAVVAFTLGDLAVNLIDTPGHPDFIAEVDRSLAVLDGAVLVVSAVEGVQAQTVVLLRALQRLRVPTLLFVNKIDRGGADPDRVLAMIRDRLTDAVVPLADRDAVLEALAERDDAVLTHLVDDGFAATAASVDLTSLLAGEVARGGLHPVLFGSARTGAGIPELMTAVRTLLPAARGDHDGPASGLVFKVERGPGGDRVAYVRLRAGCRPGPGPGPSRSGPRRHGHGGRGPPAARGGRPRGGGRRGDRPAVGPARTCGSGTGSAPSARRLRPTSRRPPWRRRSCLATPRRRVRCTTRSPRSPSRTR